METKMIATVAIMPVKTVTIPDRFKAGYFHSVKCEEPEGTQNDLLAFKPVYAIQATLRIVCLCEGDVKANPCQYPVSENVTTGHEICCRPAM